LDSQEALVIYNPAAGTMVDIDLCIGAVVHNLCSKGGYQVTVRRTVPDLSHSDVTDIVRQRPYDLVAAAGGDGTIRLVLGAVSEAAPQTPVGLIPLGTGNQLARNLRVYEDTLLGDPLPQAVHTMLSGVPTRIDLGVMNGHYFCVAAGCGPLSDAVIGPSHQDKQNLKMLAYVGSIINNLAAPPVYFRVKADGDEFKVWASGIFITNVADLGVGTLSDTAELNDGLLDLCIMNPAEFGDYLHLGFRFTGGIMGGDAPYYIRKIKNVELDVMPVESQLSDFQAMAHLVRTALKGESAHPPTFTEITAMVDGDACGFTPIKIETRGNAVAVLTPARSSMR
jgi:diacylglycerol kinase (ATP)